MGIKTTMKICTSHKIVSEFKGIFALISFLPVLLLMGCADAVTPAARDVNVPVPKFAEERKEAVNERPDAVMYLPLGKDVLMPESDKGDPLPDTIIGPYELRSETLAGALQLILDGTNIPVAYETDKGLTSSITITNLKGPLSEVVYEVCSLADLYCSYQNGMIIVKETQIFTVAIPPISASDQVNQLMTNISGAIASITGSTPVTDSSTRTIVYRATQRTAEVARRYFQRLRQNTALIVYETYIWEVALNSGNSAGIRWDYFNSFGKFKTGINFAGSANQDLGTPISIGLPTMANNVNFSTGDVLQFISEYGAVKTISQPQITVLSGSKAKLRVADTQNYLASVSRTTTDGGNTTTSTTTDQVDSGFTLEIGSNWDNATVYGDINILLQEVRDIEEFSASEDASVQLPNTTERELQTQVRIRPGDSLLIAGLVREIDNLDREGLGLSSPLIPFSRTGRAQNVELVFLMRPRVVVFTPEDGSQRTIPMKAAVTEQPKDEFVTNPVNMTESDPVKDMITGSNEETSGASPAEPTKVETQRVEETDKTSLELMDKPLTEDKGGAVVETTIIEQNEIQSIEDESKEKSFLEKLLEAPTSLFSEDGNTSPTAVPAPPPESVQRISEPFAEVPLTSTPVQNKKGS